MYPAPVGLAILRVEFDLTPEQAELYKVVFEEICKTGTATAVEISE